VASGRPVSARSGGVDVSAGLAGARSGTHGAPGALGKLRHVGGVLRYQRRAGAAH